jgi:hypothetical protein
MQQSQNLNDFARAARQRWMQLAEELKADVAEFNARQGGADFDQGPENQFRVSNSTTGLQLIITADFQDRTVNYTYKQLSDKTAGVPEGGILSMRQSPGSGVEFYSADERLTPEETREVLLDPILLPPQMAA